MSAPNKVCRACLTTKESFSYFLFDNIAADVYYFCTSVQAHESEELPKSLCDPCFELLNKYSEFKRTCISSQKTLVGYGKDIDVQEPTVPADSVLKDEENKLTTVVKIEALTDQFDDDDSSQEESLALGTEVEVDFVQVVKVRTTSRAKLIGSHKRAHTKEVRKPKKKFRFACDVCKRKFQRQDRFDAHKLENCAENGAKAALLCNMCDKSFATHSTLARHKEDLHAQVRLAAVRCGACGRVCASRHALQEHARAHKQPKPANVCHVCGKRVSTAIILRNHLETHRADRERPHPCPQCEKRFFTKVFLNSHMKRKHSGRQYICSTCNKPFTDKYNLVKHIIKHNGFKPYKCDIPSCGKSYSTNYALIEHKRTHSGDKPFPCSYCAKRFSCRRRMMDHQRIHTGEKPHHCTMCEMKFTQRGTLQRHMKIHVRNMALFSHP